jgi:hypothetical protein
MVIEDRKSTASANKPRQIVGIERVCPKCRGPVQPFQTSCDHCAHVFQFDTLSELIRSIKEDPQREREIISNYQLPFAEAAIVELFAFGCGKIQDEGISGDIRQVWFSKMNELLTMVETAGKVQIDEQSKQSMRAAIERFRWAASIETQTVENSSSASELLTIVAEVRRKYAGADDDSDTESEENMNKEIALAIESFPIPSKKGELLNLIAVCVTNGTASSLGVLQEDASAWNRKGLALIEKARMQYAGDAAFVQQLNSHYNDLRRVEKHSNLISIVLGVLFVVGIIYWLKTCE